MTDKELLELAAKAAGIDITFRPDGICRDITGFHPSQNVLSAKTWYPLDNDGDALRLAVKLDLNVFQAAGSAYALPSDDDGTYEEQVGYADAGQVGSHPPSHYPCSSSHR